MKAYFLLAIIVVLVVAVLALIGKWTQIGDALGNTFLRI